MSSNIKFAKPEKKKHYRLKLIYTQVIIIFLETISLYQRYTVTRRAPRLAVNDFEKFSLNFSKFSRQDHPENSIVLCLILYLTLVMPVLLRTIPLFLVQGLRAIAIARILKVGLTFVKKIRKKIQKYLHG